MRFACCRLGPPVVLLASAAWWVMAQSPQVTSVQRLANGDLQLGIAHPAGSFFRIEVSQDLTAWQAVSTVKSTGTTTLTDTGAGYDDQRHYRAVPLDGTAWVTGDHFSTTQGDALVHPINHASLLITWNGLALYSDPVGATSLYQSLPKGDVILVTHSHGDHFDANTLNAMRATTASIVAPQAVYNSMSATLKGLTTVLANGASTTVSGLTIDAVPAYNSNHPKGAGNGYVVTLGGRRFFFSGDTGDVAEIRALTAIDVAFLSMNVPYTMNVTQAASTVRDMKPGVVYPYHYRNQDNSLANLVSFRQLVGTDLGTEVRTRAWY